MTNWTNIQAPSSIYPYTAVASSAGRNQIRRGSIRRQHRHLHQFRCHLVVRLRAYWYLLGYGLPHQPDGINLRGDRPDGKLAVPPSLEEHYISTNSGLTWTEAYSLSIGWDAVASSADGTKIVAGAPGTGIFYSSDSGANWMQSSAPSGNWYSVASSANGNQMIAADGYGGVYISTNSGTNWNKTSLPAIPYEYTSVASSADGTRLFAGADGQFIYASGNSGVTWVATSAPTGGWNSIASSIGGRKQIGGRWCTGLYLSHVGSVFVSSNSGATWTPSTVPSAGQTTYFVASSANGTRVLTTEVGATLLGARPHFKHSDRLRVVEFI